MNALLSEPSMFSLDELWHTRLFVWYKDDCWASTLLRLRVKDLLNWWRRSHPSLVDFSICFAFTLYFCSTRKYGVSFIRREMFTSRKFVRFSVVKICTDLRKDGTDRSIYCHMTHAHGILQRTCADESVIRSSANAYILTHVVHTLCKDRCDYTKHSNHKQFAGSYFRTVTAKCVCGCGDCESALSSAYFHNARSPRENEQISFVFRMRYADSLSHKYFINGK